MPGLLYVPAGEGGEPHMEGAVFPRRRRKRINEERGEEQMLTKMLPHDQGDNDMAYAQSSGKGKNGGMHKMPDGMMMRDDEMKAMMNGKKKKKTVLHPRDAMKKMSKKMSSLDY